MSQQLSRREREVVRWLALGLPNKEIGIQLGIQEQTVKNHLHSIYGKLMPKRSGGERRKKYRMQLALRMWGQRAGLVFQDRTLYVERKENHGTYCKM